ncbi:MAG: amino acid-binding protein [Actinobacteria bacterium]|nr:amino acid-binding protein [Actinomycetota bacterium]
MHEFAITAIGQDRPGIVAGFTEVLLALGCNLADCSMSLLRNEFAMILLVESPQEVGADRLNTALEEPARRFDLVVTTREFEDVPGPEGDVPFVVSVYGKDRPGIVHAVSRALADMDVNITDLRSHLVGGDLYAMILDVAVPPALAPEEVAARLQAISRDLGVSLTFRSTEAAEL